MSECEFSNSGEGCYVKNLFSYSPIHLFTSDKTHPNPPLKKEGTRESRHAERNEESHSNYIPLSRPSDTLSLGEGTKSLSPLPLGEGRILNELASCKNSGEGAFTLAETLITLGIIGVVAALTIAPLVQKYRIKQLEARFKKTDAIISQAITKTLTELGLETFSDLEDVNFYGNREESLQAQIEKYDQVNDIWEKQFKFVKKVDDTFITNKGIRVHDFWGGMIPYGYSYSTYGNLKRKYYLLNDGAQIGIINYHNIACYGHCAQPLIFFDTNGPFKGPNRRGYDMFYYQPVSSFMHCDPLVNNCLQPYCNTNIKKDCYFFAKEDVNPYDGSKGYWESLYRPKSWWESLNKK